MPIHEFIRSNSIIGKVTPFAVVAVNYPDISENNRLITFMENLKKVCQHCKTPITGRADKRFCSDQCRAITGNSRKLEDKGEVLMRQVNQVLRRNRNILKQASPQGKTTLRREVLQQAGFNFTYFTNLYRTNRGNTYYFCYDYGYLLLPEEKVLIVSQQAYMVQ